MALGAGAGAHEGDVQRAQLALQRRGQDIGVMEGERNRAFRLGESAREDTLRRDQMARQDRQFRDGLEQRNQERVSAEAREARDFDESVRRFDAGMGRQGRQDAWDEALKWQQLEDMRLRHDMARSQYGEMMAAANKGREQRENMERMAKSGIGLLMRSAIESPDGIAPPEAVDYARRMLGDESIVGMGFDSRGGNMVLSMQQFDANGKPLTNQDGSPAIAMKPFVSDKFRAILNEVYGSDWERAADANAVTLGRNAALERQPRKLNATEMSYYNKELAGLMRERDEARKALKGLPEHVRYEVKKDKKGRPVLVGGQYQYETKDGKKVLSGAGREAFEAVREAQGEVDEFVGRYRGSGDGDDRDGGGAYPEGGADGLSAEERDALEWARANPHDPRAQQILDMLGVSG